MAHRSSPPLSPPPQPSLPPRFTPALLTPPVLLGRSHPLHPSCSPPLLPSTPTWGRFASPPQAPSVNRIAHAGSHNTGCASNAQPPCSLQPLARAPPPHPSLLAGHSPAFPRVHPKASNLPTPCLLETRGNMRKRR
ncbi:hypothetical protein AB1Y20_001197 [Prymnesium parvum]|uniref:Uncharacterized protein n=1 Tax=Prymnesium parvum TaxID=97485 RepID=A0AB34K7K9_PRYPA